SIAAAFALGWQLHDSRSSVDSWQLRRITTDTGLSATPAISPDGTLVAYSSDRSMDGRLDLYIKPVAGGQPVRLTSDGAGNTMPAFSPDGRRIVFRSKRDDGGIFEISALGGEARLVAPAGWDPVYSPDGSKVAYWSGARSVATSVPGSGAVWVTPLS